MTATTEVLDLVERWAAAERANDAGALDQLANVHIGMLQQPRSQP